MSLTPFIKWYPPPYSLHKLLNWYERAYGRDLIKDGGCIVRGHGLNEDVLYLCGDKPARYLVPALPMTVEYGSDHRPVLIEIYDNADNVAPRHVYIRDIGNHDVLLNW